MVVQEYNGMHLKLPAYRIIIIFEEIREKILKMKITAGGFGKNEKSEYFQGKSVKSVIRDSTVVKTPM